jgi:hypothetical protein
VGNVDEEAQAAQQIADLRLLNNGKWLDFKEGHKETKNF